MTEKNLDIKLKKNECRLLDDSLYCNLGDKTQPDIREYPTEEQHILNAFEKIERMGNTRCGDQFKLSKPVNPDLNSLSLYAIYETDFVPEKFTKVVSIGKTDTKRGGRRDEYRWSTPHSFHYKECKRYGFFHHGMVYTDDISDQLLAQRYLKKLDGNR